MSTKKVSLADKISSLLTTTPNQIESDNDFEDSTKAQLQADIPDDGEEETFDQSQFRKQNIDLLADVDKRYAGKGGSRKDLDSDDFSESENNLEDTESDKPDEENYSKESSDVEETDDSESDQECQEDFDSPELEDKVNFNTLKDNDVSSQIKKGMCLKNQMKIWENLLEMRIQMQKCLLAANRMPNYEKYKEIKKESGQEFAAGVQKTKKSLSTLLDKLLLLQNIVWKKYPETKKIQSKKQPDDDPDNEEIPSDTEDDADSEDSDEGEESPKKRVKISDFESAIQNQHTIYKQYRNSVIQKWHEKTRIPVMKNSTNTHSIINHIEHSLADKDKLNKKTRMKRSDYTIIGEESDDNENQETDNQLEKPTEYNSEIFDDGDFYHHLLRELIEFKSADLTDPVQLGRQWIQLQNLRSKMKRKIDTRATKGRKIRYAVHTKLVNFMAPIDYNSWTDEAKTELFGSLFGKTAGL